MRSRPALPWAEVASVLLLAALVAATIVQLLDTRARLFGTRASTPEAVRASDAALDAYALARSGLERFVADRHAYGFVGTPERPEHVRIELPAGHADVALEPIQPSIPTLPPLFAVRSRGAAVVDSHTVEREVVQLAVWRDGTFAPAAVWSAAGGRTVRVNGSIDGRDACTGRHLLPALATGTAADVSLAIDWRTILDETARSEGREPVARYSRPDPAPIIRVDGDHQLGRDGRGVLLVTGDLLITNGRAWHGVVLVGGRVVMRQGARIAGAVVTGLGAQIGLQPAGQDVIEASAAVRYDSCAVDRAADAFGALKLVPNTWLDD